MVKSDSDSNPGFLLPKCSWQLTSASVISRVRWRLMSRLYPTVCLWGLTGVMSLQCLGQHLTNGKSCVCSYTLYLHAYMYAWFYSQASIWSHSGKVTQGHQISLKCMWEMLRARHLGTLLFTHLWFESIRLFLFAFYWCVVVMLWCSEGTSG